jgi:hypothetical protein
MVKIKLSEKKKRLPKETQKGRRRRKVNEDKPQGKFNSHHVTSQERLHSSTKKSMSVLYLINDRVTHATTRPSKVCSAV